MLNHLITFEPVLTQFARAGGGGSGGGGSGGSGGGIILVGYFPTYLVTKSLYRRTDNTILSRVIGGIV
jgi:hypothetical protein